MHVVYETLHARTPAFCFEQTVLLIVAVGIGSPFFNVKGEQEITKAEVAMPFLHLFARGAQVLNAGLPFQLKGRHFPKIVFLGG